jgi:hypothetical protein
VIFTDEDLKRFRSEYDDFPVEKIEALLTRLEAAEAVCHLHGADTDKPWQYKNWCKVSGKERF